MKNRINEILKNKKYYAHTKGSNKELLLDHLLLTEEYYIKLDKIYNLEKVVKNIIKEVYFEQSELSINETYDFFTFAIYSHDIGKINPSFQAYKMNNLEEGEKNGTDSEHSIISAMIYFDICLDKILNSKLSEKEKILNIYVVSRFAYIISRHHSKLDSIKEFFITMLDKYEIIGMNKIYSLKIDKTKYEGVLDYCLNAEDKVDSISLYILTKLLYSLLVTCDYLSTTEYMTGEKIELREYRNEELFNSYQNNKINKIIREYEKGLQELDGINKSRSDMFLEVENNLIDNLNKNIFYLEAPTGSGKTNVSINIARILYKNIKDIRSINYIFPFNTLVEQTAEVFKRDFKEDKDFVVINSLNEIPINNMILDKNDTDYELSYMKFLLRDYEIKITSHVNLFESLFGCNKESNVNLYDYINSIIIIDEIQAYTSSKWINIIKLLDKYAKLLNVKFVIMSATLPKLDRLLDVSVSGYCNLLQDSSIYYSKEEFKNRTKPDFTLLDIENFKYSDLLNKVKEYKGKKILVEFITKESAREFFDLASNYFNNIFEITGDDNAFIRKNVLKKVNKLNDVLLVCTQTIEAGTDIDMDVGFKNVSTIESEEQFQGRINRSFKKGAYAKVYFFKIVDPQNVYKGDVRLNYTILNKENRKYLETKDFYSYYERVFKLSKNISNKYITKYNNNKFMEYCKYLNYSKIYENVKLIDTNTIQIFFCFKFQDYNNIYDGKEVLEEYIKVCQDRTLSYAKFKIKLSKLRKHMNLFSFNFNIRNNDILDSIPQIYGIYYIENGGNYVQNGKLDRRKFNSDYNGGLFL